MSGIVVRLMYSNIGGGLKNWLLSPMYSSAHQYNARSGTNNGKVSAIHAFFLTDMAQSDINIMAGGAQKSVDLETVSSPIGHMTN